MKDALREVMKTQQVSKYMHRYFFDALHSGFRIKSKIKYDLSECGYTSYFFVTRYTVCNIDITIINFHNWQECVFFAFLWIDMDMYKECDISYWTAYVIWIWTFIGLQIKKDECKFWYIFYFSPLDFLAFNLLYFSK